MYRNITVAEDGVVRILIPGLPGAISTRDSATPRITVDTGIGAQRSGAVPDTECVVAELLADFDAEPVTGAGAAFFNAASAVFFEFITFDHRVSADRSRAVEHAAGRMTVHERDHAAPVDAIAIFIDAAGAGFIGAATLVVDIDAGEACVPGPAEVFALVFFQFHALPATVSVFPTAGTEIGEGFAVDTGVTTEDASAVPDASVFLAQVIGGINAVPAQICIFDAAGGFGVVVWAFNHLVAADGAVAVVDAAKRITHVGCDFLAQRDILRQVVAAGTFLIGVGCQYSRGHHHAGERGGDPVDSSLVGGVVHHHSLCWLRKRSGWRSETSPH